MPASCYTVRPGPESGWLTFFELTPDRRCQGFFLVLGPVAVSPDSRRMAQGMARQIVTGYKRLLDPDPAGWLSEVREILLREQPQLEFGAFVLGGERAWGLHVGRVRLVPLTAATRRRLEKEVPRAGETFQLFVRNGDRFFLGRIPREAAASLPSAEEVQGLEQGGGGDGALILTVHSLRGATPEGGAPVPRAADGRGGEARAEAAPGRGARGGVARGRRGLRLGLLLLLLGALGAAAWWYFRRHAG